MPGPLVSRTFTEPTASVPCARAGARRTWLAVAKSAGIKIVLMPVTSVLGLLISRLVITHYGEAAFGQYGLLVGIANLLPFANLGVFAVIMNAISAADHPARDERVRLTLISAFRLLAVSAVVIIAVAFLITRFGNWHALLGAGLTRDTGPLVSGLCLAMIGLALPFGVGQRIWIGLGKNHFSIVATSLNRPIMLVALMALIWIGAPAGGYVAALNYGATVLVGIVTTVFAARRISPAVGEALRDAFRLRTVRGAKVFDVAWPMLLQMTALPIALQSDRIVLSHLSTLQQLNRYNLATQLFTPILLVMSSAGMALWRVFTRDREGINHAGTSPHRMTLAFAGIGGLAAAGMALASPLLARLSTDGAVQLPILVVISFALLMVSQGMNYPLGMYMTDAAGLRFQAIMIVLMLPVNLGISIALTGPLGAAGPAIGSVVGVLLCQVLPNWIYVRRRLGIRRGSPLNAEV